MPTKQYRNLQPDKVIATVEQLERRISERFPDSSLRLISVELTAVAREAMDRAQQIGRANVPLRCVSWLLVASGLAMVIWVVRQVRLGDNVFDLQTFASTVDSSLASLVFIGAAIAFVMSWELRLKRSKALAALHELRSLAHIIDMHQLTKDPEQLVKGGPATPSSPQRTMTPFELGRYLDYCSELLSLISKTATIYIQEFPDSVALQAYNDIVQQTNDLSRNIWQKIMLLDRISDAGTPVLCEIPLPVGESADTPNVHIPDPNVP